MRGIELTPEHPIDRLVRLGEHAESAGFDTVFASCHYNNRDPFIALDRIASATALRVGPGVANPYETHPVSLASSVATLAEATDGNVIFGLGAGDRSTIKNLGIPRETPLRRVRETIDVARELFAGNTVTHSGSFTTVDAQLNYPVAHEIPIYVGAQGPQMLRMSARYADGILVNAAHPRDFKWASNEIAHGQAHRDRPGDLDVVAFASVSISPDRSEAMEAARPPVAFITGGASERVLDRHNIPHADARKIGELIEQSRFSDAFDQVTPDMISAFSITGTPEMVRDELTTISTYVDSVVTAAPLGPDLTTAVGLLGDILTNVDDA